MKIKRTYFFSACAIMTTFSVALFLTDKLIENSNSNFRTISSRYEKHQKHKNKKNCSYKAGHFINKKNEKNKAKKQSKARLRKSTEHYSVPEKIPRIHIKASSESRSLDEIKLLKKATWNLFSPIQVKKLTPVVRSEQTRTQAWTLRCGTRLRK